MFEILHRKPLENERETCKEECEENGVAFWLIQCHPACE